MSRVGRANPINSVPKYEDPIPPREAFAYERVCFMPSKDLRPLLYKIITIFNLQSSIIYSQSEPLLPMLPCCQLNYAQHFHAQPTTSTPLRRKGLFDRLVQDFRESPISEPVA